MKKEPTLLQQLVAEINQLAGWIVQTNSGYWLCSKQVEGALVRKLSNEELDAIFPYME